MEALSLKNRFDRFGRQHPKVVAFMAENHRELREGAVLELRIKSPEGRSVVTNMRVSAEDEELFGILKDLLSK